MKNNNVSKLIIAIIAVILVIAIVGGSTFAYFQWTSGTNERTSINITIQQDDITMLIEPENTVFSELKPTANCDAYDQIKDEESGNVIVEGTHPYATMYGDALVTITNNTGTMAVPSLKLRAKVTKGGTDALTSGALSHIHYAVALVETTYNEDTETWEKGTTVTGTCSSPLTANEASSNTVFTNSELVATGTFASVSTSGEWTDLPGDLSEDEKVYLPRQYDKVTKVASGVTFKAPQYATTKQYFRVYIWLDSQYTATTIGNTITDPLQNAKIELSWSPNSQVEQVTQ